MARFEANTVKGLILSLDRRKIVPAQVVDGRNFFVDIDGPRSGFSRQEAAHALIADPYFIQEFTTDADTSSWFFTRKEVVKYDVTTGQFIPVFTYTQSAVDFPWSTALVGGKHYFAKRGVGIVRYDPIVKSWTLVSGGSVPVDVVGCCEAGGRLVVQATGIVAWSVIDDGTNFIPSTATGAGFQLLALVGSFTLDSLLGVYKTVDGFLAFTKNGVMKSETITSLSPFRHRRLSVDNVPFNAFCISYIDDNKIVLLAEHGFYITEGALPVEWQPFMSEYFRTSVLPVIKNREVISVKTQFFPKSKWFTVSISASQANSIFSKAYVFSSRSNEWGVFNRTHAGFVEVTLDAGVFEGATFGYVNTTGDWFNFTYDSLDLLYPELQWYNYHYYPTPEYPARTEFGIVAFPAIGHLTDVNEKGLPGVGLYDMWNEVDNAAEPEYLEVQSVELPAVTVHDLPRLFKSAVEGGVSLVKLGLQYQAHEQAGLDSFIEVGLFRLLDEGTGKDVGEFSVINDVLIGMYDSATVGVQFEDYVNDYFDDIIEDWLTIADQVEDWGLSSASTSVYNAEIRSTFDGFKSLELQEQALELVRIEGKSSLYSCEVTGMYHIVKLSADVAGESFHLKTLELSGNAAGRPV